MNKKHGILIIDFGSQYVQLIARCIRENNVHSIVRTPSITYEEVLEFDPSGIILSGGPSSVHDQGAPKIDQKILDLECPILGICYGMQLTNSLLGGEIARSGRREYGRTQMTFKTESPLFKNIKSESVVWMSHCDKVTELPEEFEAIATSPDTEIAAFQHLMKGIYGVQFHPEVVHTEEGKKILENYLFDICKARKDWTVEKFKDRKIAEIKKQVGDDEVILGLSGGVDSSVCAVLIDKAIGSKLHCIFVDHGLLRKGEKERVRSLFGDHVKLDLKIIDAQDRFLAELAGVTDPEEKRKTIGRIFVEVFEEAAMKITGASYLAQGTLYPDIIESHSYYGGPSNTIKSHHNVGGLPEKMGLKLLEPLKELFKDEVRVLGAELGLPEEVTNRQPFPGPGLAVRVVGEITKKRLDVLREADWIIIDLAKKHGVYEKTWQIFGVLLPVKSVGVMGDARTYENVLAIRAVTSVDGMTADWAKIPYEVLGEMSSQVINRVEGINRVVFDISSKPPGTIEWE